MSRALDGSAIRIRRFRFVIAPKEPLLVPAMNKGNMLRGGFGHAFRRLCCTPECRDTRTCPLEMSCPYKAVFEPSPPAGAEALSKNHDIPRPFVFRAPQTQQTRFDPGKPFEFELVLIGRALDFLPYFVLSFRELAAEGLGLNRAKCSLDRVERVDLCANGDGHEVCSGEVVYTAEDQIFRPPETREKDEWMEGLLPNTSAGDGAIRRISIRFVTPTFLKADGEVIRRPDFHHVFKRLRDRINALSTFFGTGPVEADFKGLGQRAEGILTVSAHTDWVERFRTSSKTKQRHELSGFVGEVLYEGDLSEFLPWLTLGELVHVGKHTAWGMGQYELS